MTRVIMRSRRCDTQSRAGSWALFLSLFVFFLFLPGAGHSAQITLAWNASTDEDLVGYKVYYGTASRQYEWSIDVGNVTTYTITNLSDGVKYYFAATAYNSSNVESAYSSEVSNSASEILWRNTSTGENLVWYMDGVTRTGAAYLTSVPNQAWKIVGTNDFNSDGKPDILWRNTSSGQNLVWYMDGVTRSSSAYLTTVSNQNWKIVGTNDFNSDGKPDILWRNTSSGQNLVWYMDGVTRSSSAYLTTVTDQNWQLAGGQNDY
ncbi:MAG: FG-GAP repeat protein [Syntrophorhabdus sp. PtaU1.Bin050]|nr:MAG: FG-GAP repeat protein [Syntrophorhabdus sp. PtaU1.Bin050]